MKTEMLVPRLNTNDDEVDVVHWYVEDKEFVEKGKEIVDLESSKAVVSVESEASGYILKHSQVGDSQKVGAPLATFYSELSELEKALSGGGDTQTLASPSTETQVAATAISGVGPAQMVGNDFSTPVTAPGSRLQPVGQQQPAELEVKENQKSFDFTRFSPAAKKYIERNNIDSNRFQGMGLVSVEVVERALGLKPSITTPVSSSQLSTQTVGLNTPVFEQSTPTNPALRSEKLGKAKQLEISLLTAGQAGNINSSLTVQFNSAGIRQTLEELGSLNGQILPLILFELSRLLEEFPVFTAYYEGGQIYYYDQVNIGLAMDLGKGLKVPVVHNANLLSPAELLEAVTDYATRYLENRLSVEELLGGTITISDLSNENILHFQPLINQNQSVILGIGGDSSLDGYPMSLTLVFDHRVSAGREVAQFLNNLKQRLLSYELTNLPATESVAKTKNVQCSKCLIDLNSLYQNFGRDALMQVHIDEQGNTAYICHVCAAGL
ncbi:MAG: 2-oxoglutarate dehydrogenase [Symploca sp. SIO2E9]|nr:2-oxoglutarate dehydrogenase [Symploca sp. SIO2E9]